MDTGDSHECRRSKGTILIPLHQFEQLMYIDIFICDYASHMSLFYVRCLNLNSHRLPA